jgi:hypothetical protein
MNYGQKDLRQLARQLAALQAKHHGSDARDEVFRALRAELCDTPLWLLILTVVRTRVMQRRNTLEFPSNSVRRHRAGQPALSLLQR